MYVPTYFLFKHVAKDLLSVTKFHLSPLKCPILGQFFLFYKHIACFINPAIRPVTYMSWFYSNQLLESSSPTYLFFIIIHLLSVLTVLYDNRTSELTCCGKTSFTKCYDFNQEKLLISFRRPSGLCR